MDLQKRTLDFLDISPYVRYAHQCRGATNENHKIPWRYIYDYEFLYITAGSIAFCTEDDRLLLQPGEIYIIPPMLWHSLEIPAGESCCYYSVHFDFINLGQENDFSPEEVYIARCNSNLCEAPVDERLIRRPLCVLGSMELPRKMRISDPINYTKILSDIIHLQAEKPFAFEIDLKCKMLLLLKQVLNDLRAKILGPAENGSDGLSGVTQYLLEHYNESISFDAISHMFGYSYSNFRRIFKQKSGKSPNEYLTDVRMEKAVELLYSGNYTVSEIAYRVGYGDSAYFSRVFRQKKGCSPSAYIENKE